MSEKQEYECQQCSAKWTGKGRCHCSGCHQTFNSVSAFDHHRKERGCLDPAKVVTNKKTGETMSQNSSGYWILGKMPEAVRG